MTFNEIEDNNKYKSRFDFIIDYIIKPKENSFVRNILKILSIGYVKEIINKDYLLLHYLDAPFTGSYYNIKLTINENRKIERFITFTKNYNLRESVNKVNIDEFELYHQHGKEFLIKLRLCSSKKQLILNLDL